MQIYEFYMVDSKEDFILFQGFLRFIWQMFVQNEKKQFIFYQPAT